MHLEDARAFRNAQFSSRMASRADGGVGLLPASFFPLIRRTQYALSPQRVPYLGEHGREGSVGAVVRSVEFAVEPHLPPVRRLGLHLDCPAFFLSRVTTSSLPGEISSNDASWLVSTSSTPDVACGISLTWVARCALLLSLCAQLHLVVNRPGHGNRAKTSGWHVVNRRGESGAGLLSGRAPRRRR